MNSIVAFLLVISGFLIGAAFAVAITYTPEVGTLRAVNTDDETYLSLVLEQHPDEFLDYRKITLKVQKINHNTHK